MADAGNLYVIAAPSGTGKTTLVKALADALSNLTISISHTTREKRANEIDGLNYHFVDKTKFEEMITRGDFLEYATIFDHYYGTSKKWVEDTLAKGADVILEIDWQGHQQIKQLFPGAIGIFILPPSLTVLQERLTKRAQDSPEVIERRLADAKAAVSHIREFDYVVINDDFQQALRDLQTIVASGRYKLSRQMDKLAPLLGELINM